MFYTDNIDVVLKRSKYGQQVDDIRLKQLSTWLKKRDIKFSYVYMPIWDQSYPYAIKLRREDALMFKLVHNL